MNNPIKLKSELSDAELDALDTAYAAHIKAKSDAETATETVKATDADAVETAKAAIAYYHYVASCYDKAVKAIEAAKEAADAADFYDIMHNAMALATEAADAYAKAKTVSAKAAKATSYYDAAIAYAKAKAVTAETAYLKPEQQENKS